MKLRKCPNGGWCSFYLKGTLLICRKCQTTVCA
jgi:hypothetical protein